MEVGHSILPILINKLFVTLGFGNSSGKVMGSVSEFESELMTLKQKNSKLYKTKWNTKRLNYIDAKSMACFLRFSPGLKASGILGASDWLSVTVDGQSTDW